jgi:hypothetical protein
MYTNWCNGLKQTRLGQAGNEKGAKTTFLNQSSVIFFSTTDQPEQTNQPDESFTISLLFLRYIMAYHYEVFQKLESVCQNYFLAFSTFLINLLWLITLQNYTVACGDG